ncbi:MAG: hypothetical protein ABSE36_02365 [Terracidiphilus sp.]|jgi:hypothetical protein
MKTFVRLTRLAALLCLTGSLSQVAAHAASKDTSGTIVIVFKDGHRQSFNLSDIDRVEFAGGASSASADSYRVPSRGRFIGKWECGDGQGNNFYITLNEDGTAFRSIGDVRGHWEYVDGEARVTWEDGRKDAIRKSGPQYFKFAYGEGKSFTDDPDNVAHARNTSAGPA